MQGLIQVLKRCSKLDSNTKHYLFIDCNAQKDEDVIKSKIYTIIKFLFL